MQTVQSAQVGEALGTSERGQGVRGRCKHSLLPPKPACSLGERPLPPSPHGTPAARAQGVPSPTASQPLPIPPCPSLQWICRGGTEQCSIEVLSRVWEVGLGWQPALVPLCDLGLTISRIVGRRRATWKWQRQNQG